MAVPVSWDKLPLIVTSVVFGYLKNKDRFNASLVCKDWSEALYSRNIWKRIKLEITGDDEVNNVRTVKLMKRVGAWVREVEIRFWVTESSVKNMSKVFDSLHEGRLTKVEMNIQRFGDINYKKDSQLRIKLSALINMFIRTQTCLKWFDIRACGIPVDLGLEILENLSLVSGDTLNHLDITSFFSPRSLGPNGVHSRPGFRSSMSRFTQLRSVKIDYYCLDKEVLLGLAQNCAGILQDLTVFCTDSGFCAHSISSCRWSTVHSLCPNLRVKVWLLLQDNTSDVTRLLPQLMPLGALRFTSRPDNVSARGLIQHFHHFTDSLEELDLDLHPNYDTTSEEMVNFVISCSNLKVLKYKGVLHFRQVAAICEAQRDGRMKLERCEFRVIGRVARREASIRATVNQIRAEYGPIFDSQNAQLVLEYV